MSDQSGSSERVDTAALLLVAREAEPTTSERTLESWRHQGLLPHPQRTGQDGARPIWTYPADTIDHLRALLRLRVLTKDPNLLRVALWLHGHPVPTACARASMIGHLRALRTDIDTELAKRSLPQAGEDPSTTRMRAIGEIARTYARRRTGTPRFGRQRLSQREQAFTVLFGLALGEPAAVEALEDTAEDAERAIGLDQGRRYRPDGATPLLAGPAAEGMALFAAVGNLPRLIQTLEDAEDAELDAARPIAATVLVGLTTFARMADAFAGYRNATGMTGLITLEDNLSVRVMLPGFVVALMRSPDTATNLATVDTALRESILPVHEQIHRLAALPPDELAARLPHLEHLPIRERSKLLRLIRTGRPAADDATDDDPPNVGRSGAYS